MTTLKLLKPPLLLPLSRTPRIAATATLLVLATLSQLADATVLFDNYRGRNRVEGGALVSPNYLNDNNAHDGLTNLINFAAADSANIASSGQAPNINWSSNSFGLCNNENAAGAASDACVQQIQGKVIFALVKFPSAGTYTFSAAHDDELKIEFSTNYSAANANNYRGFDYNVPVGGLPAYGGENAFQNVPGNFQVSQAGACYVMRVHWNNRGGLNHLRMRWTPPGSAADIIPAANLLDPSQSASYEGCANVQTDLGVSKAGPANFLINPDGSAPTFNYTIKVWNYGPVPTSAVTVADTLPNNVSAVGAPTCTASGAATCGSISNNGTAYVMTTGNMPVNSSSGDPNTPPSSGDFLTYTFTVKPMSSAVSISNTATITVNDLNPNNNSSTVISAKQGLVSVQKSGPVTAVAGQTFDYRLTVTNGSSAAIAKPTVAELLPSNIRAVAVNGANCGNLPSAPGALLKCVLPSSIAAGANASFTITVDPEFPGSSTNYASTDPLGSEKPGQPGPNCTQTAYSCASVKTDITNAPAVKISKTFDPTSIPVGGSSLLSITISNASSQSALTELTLTDVLPAGVLADVTTLGNNTCGGSLTASDDGTRLTLTDGALDAGSDCVLEWDVSSSVVGSYHNEIPAKNVTTREGASNDAPATADLNVATEAAISTIKQLKWVNRAPMPAGYRVRAGDELTYAITVSNKGGTAGSTTLTETVGQGVRYAGFSTEEGWNTTPAPCAAPGSRCTQTVQVAPNSQTLVTFTVVVLPVRALTAVNNIVRSSEGDCPRCNIFNPVAAADMQATGATTQEVLINTPVTITTSCTNAGPDAALNATCSVTGGPADASTVCTPTPPISSLRPGGKITCVTSFTPTETGSVTVITKAGSESPDLFPNNNQDESAINAIAPPVVEPPVIDPPEPPQPPTAATPVPVDARWMLALITLAIAASAALRKRRRA